MDFKSPPNIVSAQRARDGVIIEFDDNSAALYPVSLLAEVFPRAIKLEQPEPAEE